MNLLSSTLVVLIIVPFMVLIYRSYKKQKKKSPEQRRKDGKKGLIVLTVLFVFSKLVGVADQYLQSHDPAIIHANESKKAASGQ